jgi:hypothetical protein
MVRQYSAKTLACYRARLAHYQHWCRIRGYQHGTDAITTAKLVEYVHDQINRWDVPHDAPDGYLRSRLQVRQRCCQSPSIPLVILHHLAKAVRQVNPDGDRSPARNSRITSAISSGTSSARSCPASKDVTGDVVGDQPHLGLVAVSDEQGTAACQYQGCVAAHALLDRVGGRAVGAATLELVARSPRDRWLGRSRRGAGALNFAAGSGRRTRVSSTCGSWLDVRRR